MARKRMVTRAFEETKAILLCVELDTAEAFNDVITVAGNPKDTKILARYNENSETTQKKAVHVVSRETYNVLRGMDENDFIANSIVLDPETRKPIGTDEDVDLNEAE